MAGNDGAPPNGAHNNPPVEDSNDSHEAAHQPNPREEQINVNGSMARRHDNNIDLGNNFVFFHRAPHVAVNEPPPPPRLPHPDPHNDNDQGDAPPPNEDRIIEDEIAYVVNEDGVVEGGVAVAAPIGSYLEGTGGNGGRSSRDCDLVLLIECVESLQTLPHSVAKEGTTIAIGLDKTTKLNAVFSRFAEFCTVSSHNKEPINPSDIEFVHNDILQEKETAESSALMKNDRIRVRRKRAHEREEEVERQRIQRDSDRTYFKHLRSLLPDLTVGGTCDVVFDCRGRLVENGMEQMVLSTAVKAHSSIISRRCPWLGDKIRLAREQQSYNIFNRIPGDISPSCYGEKNHPKPESMDSKRSVSFTAGVSPSSQKKSAESAMVNVDDGIGQSVDDEDDDSVQPYPIRGENDERKEDETSRLGAAKVVAEDDDVSTIPSDLIGNDGPCCENASNISNRSSSPVLSSLSGVQNMLWVTLDDHPPEAVKLLLEYCYTNRCIPLGHQAFVQASKGAVSPYHYAGWPKGGRPTVSTSIALAGIALAEEARMPRLSLMCEIAASNLISNSTILDALSLSTTQYRATGNRLSILRKSAMQHLLQRPVLMEVSSTTNFLRTLNDERDVIVPSLLAGAQEIVPAASSKKRTRGGSDNIFQLLDEEDKVARGIERKKYKKYREERKRASLKTNRQGGSSTTNASSQSYQYQGWSPYDVMPFRSAVRNTLLEHVGSYDVTQNKKMKYGKL